MTCLKILRLKRGLSQESLAKMLSIHPTLMSRLECGWLARISPQLEQRLQAVFGKEWTFTKLMEQPPDFTPGES
jgi:transcriptional regulator with XRE-family HTH domain